MEVEEESVGMYVIDNMLHDTIIMKEGCIAHPSFFERAFTDIGTSLCAFLCLIFKLQSGTKNGLFLLLVFTILFINFHFPKYYIRTGSMEPALHVGAVVFC